MEISAFVQTPFLTRHVTSPHLHVCMSLGANRYDPSFARSQKPLTPSSKPFSPTPSIDKHYRSPIHHTENGNGATLSNGTPPPPPADTPYEDFRPERPDEEPSESLTTPLHQRSNKLSHNWPALHNRLLANPRLPLQLAVELTVGFVSKTLAEVQDRGENFVNQLDHYFCNLSLELFGDAMLVWLLSPVAGTASLLPKHFLQIGKFTPLQRVTGFVWKGVQFGVVGIASSAVGQGVTRVLVKARGGDVEHLPEVLPNCAAWGGFLLLSSNTRYQLINGFEQRVLEKWLPGGLLGAGVTFAVRFGNCYLGGVQWLPWARFLGVQ